MYKKNIFIFYSGKHYVLLYCPNNLDLIIVWTYSIVFQTFNGNSIADNLT